MTTVKKILCIFLSCILMLSIIANHPYALRTVLAEETELRAGENATVGDVNAEADEEKVTTDEASKVGDEQKAAGDLSEAADDEAAGNPADAAAGESRNGIDGGKTAEESPDGADGGKTVAELPDGADESRSGTDGGKTAEESPDGLNDRKTTTDSVNVSAAGETAGEEAEGEPTEAAAGEDIQTVSTWQEILDAAKKVSSGTVIRLAEDIVNTENKDRIQIPEGKKVIIDLNGHELNRNRTTSHEDGHVIEVFGDLTIRDSGTNGRITGGYATNGGGINVHGGTFVLESGTIRENHATNGGGIYVNDGSCTIKGGSVSSNEATKGGGIYINSESKSSLTVTGGSILNNEASEAGGGILCFKAMSLSNCEVTNNTAATKGGGIYHEASESITLTNVDIKGNTVYKDSDGSGYGGGLFVEKGSTTINGGTINGNFAKTEGGAIYTNADNTIALNNVTVSRNKSDSIGGAFYVQTGHIVMEDGQVSKNESPSAGGVNVTDKTSFAATGVTFTENKSTQAGGGAVFCSSGGTVSMDSCTLTGNSAATDGGAIWNNGTLNMGGSMSIENNGTSNLYLYSGVINVTKKFDSASVIWVTPREYNRIITSGFTANGNSQEDMSSIFHLDASETPDLGILLSGGEVYAGKIDYVSVNSWKGLQDAVNNATDGKVIKLTQNITASSSDDRIKIPSGKSVIIDLDGNTLNRDLTEEDNDGHVIEVFGTLTIRDTSFSQYGKITGGAAENGGGINVNGGTLYFESGEVAGNKAKDGGGIYVNGDGKLVMTGGSVHDNEADDEGGGVFSYNKASFKNCRIYNNTAKNKGGGIYHDDGEKIWLENMWIESNKVQDSDSKDGGGGLYLDSGSAELNKCYFNDNFVKNKGGGIFMNSSSNHSLTLTDTVFMFNSAEGDGAGIYLQTASITMTGGEFIKNHADGAAAGVCVTKNTTFTAENVKFEENVAKGAGGAVQSEGTITLNNCTFQDNEAGRNGGTVDASGTLTTISNCTIHSSSCMRGNGGGIYTGKGTVDLSNLTIDGCRAQFGGGLYVNTTTKIHGNVQVGNNTADYYNNVYIPSGKKLTVAGALDDSSKLSVVSDKDATITTGFNSYHSDKDATAFFAPEDGYILDKDEAGEIRVRALGWLRLQDEIDEAESGGVITLTRDWTASDMNTSLTIPAEKELTLDLSGFSLDGNKKVGTTLVVEGTLTLKDEKGGGTITGGTGNEAGKGGGICVKQGAKLTMEGGTITGNEAEMGAGICNDNGEVEILGGEISHNVTPEHGQGGGIYNAGELTIKGGKISHNISGLGGGMYGESGMRLEAIEAIEISANEARLGGGIYCEAESMELRDITIFENTAKENGGGVYATQYFALEQCEIKNNTAGKAGGGIYIQGGTNHYLHDTSVCGNMAKTAGGGVYLYNGKLTLNGCTEITGNTAILEGGGIECMIGGELEVIQYTKVIGNNCNTGKNIMLYAEGNRSAVVRVSDSLNSEYGARIDLATHAPEAALTAGFGSSGVSKDIFSYEESDIQLIVKDGELYLPEITADVWVSGWKELQNKIKAVSTGQVIALSADLDGSGEDVLEVDGKEFVLELNGHTIDRKRNSSDDDGHVFEIQGHSKMTIRDSRGTGVITGGYAENGGGINIHDGSTLTIEGGTIRGNRASIDGGGICVRGTLIMTGGSVVANKASDTGGGIYCSSGGKVTLTNARITGNEAKNEGGGMHLHLEANTTFTGCVIENNESLEGNGGGMHIEASGKTLTLSNVRVDDNSAANYGGGIFLKEGTLLIGGEDGSVSGNTALVGGGIYAVDTTRITGGKFASNTATGDLGQDPDKDKALLIFLKDHTGDRYYGKGSGAGGFIYSEKMLDISGGTYTLNKANFGAVVFSSRTANISGGTFVRNTAANSGGVLRMNGGTVTITGGTMTENTADNYFGGALFVTQFYAGLGTVKNELDDAAVLKLFGGTITNNSAGFRGGGICTLSMEDIQLKGQPVVQNNDAPMGKDFHLDSSQKLNIAGEIEGGSRIGVSLANDLGVFTKNYSKNNSAVPDTWFYSCDGYEVYLKNNEAAVKPVSYTPEDEETMFLPRKDQIETDSMKITSKNWMAGVSGERYLNEINLPVAHDSAMNEVRATTGSYGGRFAVGPIFAKAQSLYIDELLNIGVRSLDMRLTNYYEVQKIKYITGIKYVSEPEDELWICHGKNKLAGCFWAADRDGSALKLSTVFTWVKTFLTNHPSETVIMTFDSEVFYARQDRIVMERLKKLLEKLSEEINPSTNESFVYWENGVLQPYTHYPQLKDCRGKIVVRCPRPEQIGGFTDGTGLKTVYSEDEAHCKGPEKIRRLKNFYQTWGGKLLPTNALQHDDFAYAVGTHGHGEDILDFTDSEYQPVRVAKRVQEALFIPGGLFDKVGEYLGWVRFDGASANASRYIWKSNFFDGLEYCTITVKSGLDEASFPTQTYKVLKGTPITIPGSIYENVPAEKGNFLGWTTQNSGECLPNQTFTVMEDTTFLAGWGGDVRTPIQVVWQDGENKDNLRPEALQINVNGQNAVTVSKTSNWSAVYTGGITDDAVQPIWEKILITVKNPQGADTEGQYRYTLYGEAGKGYTLTLIHTPAGTVTASGTIVWDDDEDKAHKRPDTVTIHLMADGSEKASQSVTAANDWQWSLGDFPEYKDGKKIAYTLTEDAFEGYTLGVDGFSVTNSYIEPGTIVEGYVTWMDDENANSTRPDTVTLQLLADGEVVDSEEFDQGYYGDWHWVFDITELEKSGKDYTYSVRQEPVEGYVTQIEAEDGYFSILNKYGSKIYFKAHSLSLEGDVGVNFYLDLTEEEAADAAVSFQWFDQEKKDVRPVYDERYNLYRVSCPVAVAEMSFDVTAVLTIGGDKEEVNTFSVLKYANVILTSEDLKQQYLADESLGQEKYDRLTALVKVMLDYGAKAQTAFVTNTEALANANLTAEDPKSVYYYVPDEVTADTVEIEAANMSEGLAAYGLKYAGSSIVYLSKTAIRHYYVVTDQELFDAVKDSVVFDGKNVSFKEKNGLICFERANVAASELDTRYVLRIGENDYAYSALNYVRACLLSENVSNNTKELVRATWRYWKAAKTYFTNSEDNT